MLMTRTSKLTKRFGEVTAVDALDLVQAVKTLLLRFGVIS
jgi:hypothetical protein